MMSGQWRMTCLDAGTGALLAATLARFDSLR
jgi:hypothetical protein